MEKQKYLEPKFSYCLIPLIKYLFSKGNVRSSFFENVMNEDQSKQGSTNHNSYKNIMISDTLSVSSLMSIDSKSNQPYQAKLSSLRVINDQARSKSHYHNESIQFSMQEKSIEEEEDEKFDLTDQIRNQGHEPTQEEIKHASVKISKNSSIILNENVVQKTGIEMKNQIRPNYYLNNRRTNQNTLLEPFLKNKYTNRTVSVQPVARHLQKNLLDLNSPRKPLNRDTLLTEIYNDNHNLKQLLKNDMKSQRGIPQNNLPIQHSLQKNNEILGNLINKSQRDSFSRKKINYSQQSSSLKKKIKYYRPETEMRPYKNNSQLSHFSYTSDGSLSKSKDSYNSQLLPTDLNQTNLTQVNPKQESYQNNYKLSQYQLVKNTRNLMNKNSIREHLSLQNQKSKISKVYSGQMIRPKFANNKIQMQNLQELAKIHDEYNKV